MKVRFYHWWIYKLYRWTWNPILKSDKVYRQLIIDSMLGYEYQQNRYASVDQMLADMLPEFYVETWKSRDKDLTKSADYN